MRKHIFLVLFSILLFWTLPTWAGTKVTLGEFQDAGPYDADAGTTTTQIVDSAGYPTPPTGSWPNWVGFMVWNVTESAGGRITADNGSGTLTHETISGQDETDTYYIRCVFDTVSKWNQYIDASNPDSKSGGSGAGLNTKSLASTQKYKALFAIDCSSIPAASTVDDAILYLMIDLAYEGTADTIGAYQVWKTTWTGADATWNDFINPDSEWGTAGCESTNDSGSENTTDGGGDDRKATAAVTLDVVDDDAWVNFNGAGLDALVEDWIDGTYTDAAGIILIHSETSDIGEYCFFSSPGDTANQRPVLFVEYSPTATGGQVIIINQGKVNEENYTDSIYHFCPLLLC